MPSLYRSDAAGSITYLMSEKGFRVRVIWPVVQHRGFTLSFILEIISFIASAPPDHLLHHSPPCLQGHTNNPIKKGWEILFCVTAGSQACFITPCVRQQLHECSHAPLESQCGSYRSSKVFKHITLSYHPITEKVSSIYLVPAVSSSSVNIICILWVMMIPAEG